MFHAWSLSQANPGLHSYVGLAENDCYVCGISVQSLN